MQTISGPKQVSETWKCLGMQVLLLVENNSWCHLCTPKHGFFSFLPALQHHGYLTPHSLNVTEERGLQILAMAPEIFLKKNNLPSEI